MSNDFTLLMPEFLVTGLAFLVLTADFVLRSERKHRLAYLSVAGLLGVLSFSLFTRILSVAEYGLLSLLLKIVGTFTVLAKLGMQQSVLRFYEEHTVDGDPNSLRCYYSTLFFGLFTIASALTVWDTSIPGRSCPRLTRLASIQRLCCPC